MTYFESCSPTEVSFPALRDEDAQELQDALSYDDPKIAKELQQLRRPNTMKRYVERYGGEAYAEALELLKSKLKISLLTAVDGEYRTLAGLYKKLPSLGFADRRAPLADERSPRRWDSYYKPYDLRYYQREAVDALMGARHASISMPTGSGKTAIIETLVREHGGRTVVMAPSLNISEQIYDQFIKAFGRRAVGMFGDGKHESKKDVVVAIGASLTKAKPEHATNFAQATQFIVDESHLLGADMYANACRLVVPNAVDRYSVSATQFRNDGTDLLLEGLAGPVVYEKRLKELIEQGFLALPRFLWVETESPSSRYSYDWDQMCSSHFHDNVILHELAARLANKIRNVFGHPVLILIDEVRQFGRMLPFFEHQSAFAHGPLNADNKKDVDPRYHKSNVKDIVAAFNQGDIPILVGTSCITTGTDLRPTGTIINLQAGASEIKFWQGVGRGTRLVPGKTGFNYIEFLIKIKGMDGKYIDKYKNVFERHFWQRHSYCKEFAPRRLNF